MSKKLKKYLFLGLALMLICHSVFNKYDLRTVYAATVTSGDASTEPMTIIKNGDFEASTADEALNKQTGLGYIGSSNWRYSVSTSTTKVPMNFKVEENAGRSGNAIKVWADSTVSSENYGKAAIYQPSITTLEAGKKYIIMFYAKAVGMNDDSTILGKLKNGSQDIRPVWNGEPASSCQEWKKFTKVFKAVQPDGDSFDIHMSNFTQPGGYWLVDDISIVELPFITISETEVALEVGDSADLTKELYDYDAEKILGDNPVVSWNSSDTDVATVNGDGKVTAVKEGTATITVTATSAVDSTKSVSASCVVTVTAAQTEEPVVSVNGVEYTGTLLEAIVEAKNSTDKEFEIDLLADIKLGETLTIGENITLDLNGKTLDMDGNSWISYGDVVDNDANKKGRLKVDATKGELSKGNSHMPVYIAGEGYMLASMKKQATQTKAENLSSFNSISRPSFGPAHAAKLANGATDAGLQFIIRLDWGKDNDGKFTDSQEFSYSDSLVQTVYKDGKAFSVTITGLTNYVENMKVTEYVKSDLGVVWENNSFYMKEASAE